ncbi:LysE family translocator [Solwaraspora sp. WMMD1047]|uniref:LysE family translocator n=1 Tax=Solwaraspora sp. WMMD1047 TaxID=3016102 RepID=UPI002416D083|nr:LysE family translocator [Solwaraspora sp. WMMD1047]MDG4829154.1 LysE family translocator [Solwaraspora sp. WMMD1047]
MRGVATAAFVLAVAPITLTPGTSLTLVVSQVAANGRRPGWWVILGTVTGLYLHACLAAAGLAALLLRSAQALWLVKTIGAGYLVALGLWLIWSAAGRRGAAARREGAGSRGAAMRREGAGSREVGAAGARRRRWLPARARHPYLQGLLGNVLNPKAAAIYLTLAPQFLQPGATVLPAMLALATGHAVLHTAWLAGWTVLSHTAARLLRGPTALRALNRLAGGILVGLGVRTIAG